MLEGSKFGSGKLPTVVDRALLVLTAIILSLGTFLFLRQCSSEVMGNRKNFSGKIIEKRVSVDETKQGSKFVNSLLVEEESGRRFYLPVTDEMYKRAEVGMWIRRDKNSVYLLDSLQQQPSPQ